MARVIFVLVCDATVHERCLVLKILGDWRRDVLYAVFIRIFLVVEALHQFTGLFALDTWIHVRCIRDLTDQTLAEVHLLSAMRLYVFLCHFSEDAFVVCILDHCIV